MADPGGGGAMGAIAPPFLKVVKCEVDQSKPGENRIEYTPTVHGRHELTVSVCGQQVAGSPFPVSVSISPAQLDEPVKVWRDIQHLQVSPSIQGGKSPFLNFIDILSSSIRRGRNTYL